MQYINRTKIILAKKKLPNFEFESKNFFELPSERMHGRGRNWSRFLDIKAYISRPWMMSSVTLSTRFKIALFSIRRENFFLFQFFVGILYYDATLTIDDNVIGSYRNLVSILHYSRPYNFPTVQCSNSSFTTEE